MPMSDELATAVERLAEEQGATVDEIAALAVHQYLADDRTWLRAAIGRVVEEDAELLARLSR